MCNPSNESVDYVKDAMHAGDRVLQRLFQTKDPLAEVEPDKFLQYNVLVHSMLRMDWALVHHGVGHAIWLYVRVGLGLTSGSGLRLGSGFQCGIELECGLSVHRAWHGMAWHGMAWHGMVWHGMVCGLSVHRAVHEVTTKDFGAEGFTALVSFPATKPDMP